MTNAAADPALQVERIEMVLGEGAHSVNALRGVSLSLTPGDLLLVMGPSGSGKSTLLSIMGCILKPTRGEVSVAGLPTGNMDTEGLARLRRRHIGFVFQSYNLFPGLTARENVEASLAIRGCSAKDARQAAESALHSVGLSHRVRSLPGQMSGGEQQRVAIARAVVGKPSIILADEPTAALDGEAGRGVLQHLRRLAKEEHCAVLMVSHDARALPFADQVLSMADGRILSAQTPSDYLQSTTISGEHAHA
jgi:putative ABC transport system ATP-binding protein